MQTLYDENAPKKAANLSVNSDLLNQSRALKINLSATLEQALKEKLAEAKARQWAEQHQQGIQSYNQLIEEQGIFGEEYRTF